MDVNDAVLTRLTVLGVQGRAGAGRRSAQIAGSRKARASSQNLQPWHFVVVRDSETIRRVGEMLHRVPFVGDAPLVIALATDDTPRAQLDAGRALQQMELVAWEEGMGDVLRRTALRGAESRGEGNAGHPGASCAAYRAAVRLSQEPEYGQDGAKEPEEPGGSGTCGAVWGALCIGIGGVINPCLLRSYR